MPRGTPIPAYEVQEIMARFNQHRKAGKSIMESCDLIANHLQRDSTTIWAVVRRLRPTNGIAQDYIRANAFTLAHRVIQNASVEQSIDILSRPNIGVLEPIKKGESGGGGFYLSVQSDSCGAVRVGVAIPGNNINPAQEMTNGQAHNPDQFNEGDAGESVHEVPADTGDSRAFSFGRITRRALAAGNIGKGNAYKRGDERRPNRGQGVRKSQKGSAGHAGHEEQGAEGHGKGFLDLKSFKA